MITHDGGKERQFASGLARMPFPVVVFVFLSVSGGDFACACMRRGAAHLYNTSTRENPTRVKKDTKVTKRYKS